MATTDAGAVAIANLFAGSGAINAFNASNARIGVGDGTTAFAATQTDNIGTNKFRKLVNTAPVVTANSIDFTSTFTPTEGNFAWNEMALFNSSSGSYMATRRTVTSFGTKTPSDTWIITLTVVVTPA